MVATTSQHVISDDILARCMERAPGYDRENRFFQEDFEELRDAGYLRMAVPTELGGLGLTMADAMQEQRRLAYHAAPTALAMNMHLYWTGVAADLLRSGDTSLEWLLKEAAAGKVFAAGHSESGNDLPVLLSTTNADRVDGGYRLTGTKHFSSLTPVWDYLAVHGTDSSNLQEPKVIHGFLPRGTDGVTIREVWDTLGMRATASQDTVLDGAFVPDKYIPRVLAPGPAGVDLCILAIFAWALVGFANVYYSIAQRALDLTVESLKSRSSITVTRTLAHHPGHQQSIAEMVMELEAIGPHLDRVAQDWTDGVDHGGNWFVKLISAKYRAVEGAWRVVDTAMDLSGGAGIFRQSEIQRLWRDARLGRVHPTNSTLSHEFVAKTVLGINPDEAPRWG